MPGVDPRAETLRRGLLGLVTALIVARPLVLGEDPGLTSTLSSPSGLFLSLLWFLAAVGWGLWRAWSGQATWRGSLIEAALAVLVVIIFISVPGSTRYKHPATLVAWEWVVLLLAFCLVRQLARTSQDNRALLAAMLATGLSLSAYAIFQYTVELPGVRARYLGDAEALREAVGPNMALNDANLEHMRRRILEDNVFATYAHPNSFAGYLALLLPSAIAWAVIGWRRAPGWPRFVTIAGVLLLSAALWLTHSRGAILGSLVVLAFVLLLHSRSFWWKRKWWLLGGAIALAGVLIAAGQTSWGAGGLGKAGRSFGLRSGYWAGAWHMIRDYPWRGVGPGNFGRQYPRYMLPSAFEKVQDPHNFLLEMWATSGIFAVLALLTTLVFLLRKVWPVVRGPLSAVPNPTPPEPESGPDIRWEFYIGGMGGLVFGFLLRAFDLPGSDIVYEGMLSAGRSVIWFAAFALLDNICLGGRLRSLAITAGVMALLLNLLVSGGIAFPSVAQPLWIMAALAMNALEEKAPVLPRPSLWFESFLPLPILAGATLAYLLLIFYPTIGCNSALMTARGYGAEWERTAAPELTPKTVGGKTVEPNPAMLNHALEYMNEHIVQPLQEAIRQDPGDVEPRLALAGWYTELVKLFPGEGRFVKMGRDQLTAVQQLDPFGKDGYLAAYRLHVAAAQGSKGRDPTQLVRAAAALEQASERDPTEAHLHFESAEAWFAADDPVRGRRQASAAQAMDQQATVPERQLTQEQRSQIQTWLGEKR